jgi:two-component system sensor histidine kinase KdpD
MVTERLAGSQQQEVRYLRGDGTVIVADAAFVSICDDHGAPLSLMVFVQDVTARHAAVAALESALHREQQAAQQLRDLEETKAHLLASVSHDFQTPLTAIAGFAQLLATCWDDYDDDQKRDFAARITRNAGELDARVAEFLDLARHDHDARTLELVPCRLDDLVRQAVERCRFVLERHVVEVEVEPIELTSDAVSIGRIVDNLLTNAAKYSPPGTTVAVTVDHDGPTSARVVVRDQGAGVPADQRERIFQPFVRLEGSKASAPGAGVGLESGRALAELLGGTLTVHDNHPVGSAFTLTLPADLPPAAATPGG